MNTNISLIIPAYKRYENVYNLLQYFDDNDIRFNQIIIMHDRILDIDNSTILVYEIKIKRKYPNIQHIIHHQHKGIVGMLEVYKYLHEQEYYLWLEDDMWVDINFFYQVKTFLDQYYTERSPVFVGYSKAANSTGKFFKTYSCMPMWGWVTRGKHLFEFSLFYNKLFSESANKRRSMIEECFNTILDCEMFEAYKKKFLATNNVVAPHNLDFYINLHLINNNQRVIKNTTSYITRRDIRYAVNNPVDVIINHQCSDIEHDMISGISMWG